MKKNKLSQSNFKRRFVFSLLGFGLAFSGVSMNAGANDATFTAPTFGFVAVDTPVAFITWTGVTQSPVVTNVLTPTATSLNTAGTANTAVGNGVGATTINGSAVNVNTAGAVTVASPTVTVGNQAGGVGTSTVSFNNNRVQNVATATAINDAVNLGQVNQLISAAGATLPALQGQVNGIQNQVNNLQSQVTQNNLVAQRGIAGVSAIAGIPALETGKNFSVGVGLGNFVSASAVSLGVQARVAQSTVFKIAGSTTNYGSVVTSAGLGVSF